MDIQSFRSYEPSDYEGCLSLFDENYPKFFAWNERQAFAEFLSERPEGYLVSIKDDAVVAAFGFRSDSSRKRGRVSWIMVSPTAHGGGIGSIMMRSALERARDEQVAMVDISASQLSAPFFARFGAKKIRFTKDGWGPGMHRVDMELPVDS